MDSRFLNLGFNANPALGAFSNPGSSIRIGGVGGASAGEGAYCTSAGFLVGSSESSVPFVSIPKGTKRKWSLIDGSVNSSLFLRLGHSSSSSDSKGSTANASTSVSSAKETDEESSMDLELDFSLHLGNEMSASPKKSTTSNMRAFYVRPKVDLELSLSSGLSESDVTNIQQGFTSPQNVLKMAEITCGAVQTIERSAPLQRNMETCFHAQMTQRHAETGDFLNHYPNKTRSTTVSPDLSSSIMTIPKSSVTCSSGVTQQQQPQRSSNLKLCQFEGCVKGARGASGLCIAHGGGRRCLKPGCNKGAEGRTAFCKAHGGGRRCEFLGCTKSAEGRTDFCIAHGGGRRCSHEGCTRAARGKSGLCIRHGGGKRCQQENCTKSAEGLSGLCISHGGGRRCQYPECTKGAQGSTMLCKAHGGGKRCTFEGCNKGAEGSTPFCKGHGGGKRCTFQGGGVCPKSVHGGTLFCVAHGGGKRCAIPECTRSARGRTDFCVRHGGGRRCKFEGCGKSAQGSTDFCKAHGGGKRCSWGQPGLEFGQGDCPCNSFARGKSGFCTSHGALVQDNRVHGGATIGTMVQESKLNNPANFKEVFPAEEMSVDIMNLRDNAATSISSCDWKLFGFQPAKLAQGNLRPAALGAVPEGRVHGGSLMAMLAGSSGSKLTSGNDKPGSSGMGKTLTTRQD